MIPVSDDEYISPAKRGVSPPELIRRCVELSAEADALLELMAAGQEQLAKLEQRVQRLEMRLASCR